MPKKILIRAAKMALIVGTLLAIINYGEKVITLSMTSTEWFKLAITYLVPFSVSVWSANAAIDKN